MKPIFAHFAPLREKIPRKGAKSAKEKLYFSVSFKPSYQGAQIRFKITQRPLNVLTSLTFCGISILSL